MNDSSTSDDDSRPRTTRRAHTVLTVLGVLLTVGGGVPAILSVAEILLVLLAAMVPQSEMSVGISDPLRTLAVATSVY